MSRYVLAVALAFGLAPLALGAAPAPATRTGGPAAATTPALSAEEIKARQAAAQAVLGEFFKGMFAGDAKAALGLLSYADPAKKPMADAMLGQVLAEQRLRKAVTAAFGAEAKFPVGRSDADAAAFETDFKGATPKVSADGMSATIAMPLGISYVLTFKGGQWRVDFDKTQADIGPLPKVEDLEAMQKMTAGYDLLTADVAAKKHASVEDVVKAMEAINAATKVKVAPTTQP